MLIEELFMSVPISSGEIVLEENQSIIIGYGKILRLEKSLFMIILNGI